MEIEKEISQTKAFRNVWIKADINILFTSSWLTNRKTEILKPYDISQQQFNILRILRGMNPEPATVKMLTERMIDKMSNASRLVEKLRKKAYVERKECSDDRRRVDIYITPKGLDVVEKASIQLESAVASAMNLNIDEAEQLNNLLDKLRK